MHCGSQQLSLPKIHHTHTCFYCSCIQQYDVLKSSILQNFIVNPAKKYPNKNASISPFWKLFFQMIQAQQQENQLAMTVQKHFLWTIEGPDSSYSGLEIHICWKVEREARMDPPIHTEYFLSGGAIIFIFIVLGARDVISFCIRSPIPGNGYRVLIELIKHNLTRSSRVVFNYRSCKWIKVDIIQFSSLVISTGYFSSGKYQTWTG